ncbi:MAG TPA: methyltransferase domain-containing protein [Ilumatobacter sp.]
MTNSEKTTRRTSDDSSAETFQIPIEVAELYEAKFVPALFAEWAPRLAEAAAVKPGDAVLDVACGTGIVARTAADIVGSEGRVVGVDLNAAMLAVAARVRPDIEWRQGDVAQLPFSDAEFDAVLCQMALMFFPDRARALGEMRRVIRPDGTVAVCVPASLDAQPAYGPFVEMAARHAGPEAVSLLSTYWACGDLDALMAVTESVGLVVSDARTVAGVARFASPEELVATEVESTPLIERISDQVYARIKAGAAEALQPYVTTTGAVDVPLVAHLVTARAG